MQVLVLVTKKNKKEYNQWFIVSSSVYLYSIMCTAEVTGKKAEESLAGYG